MTTPLIVRPRPLQAAAALWGRVVAGVGGVLAALVTAGALTAGQGAAVASTFTALDGVVVATVALVAVVGPLLSAFGIVKQTEPQVTPVADPAVQVPGGELVSLEVPALELRAQHRLGE